MAKNTETDFLEEPKKTKRRAKREEAETETPKRKYTRRKTREVSERMIPITLKVPASWLTKQILGQLR